jgi:hypothetical protein
MAEQDLNGAQIDAGFEQVRGEGVPQRVRMDGLRDPGPMSSVAARQEDRFHRDRLASTCTGEEPVGGFPASPVTAQKLLILASICPAL